MADYSSRINGVSGRLKAASLYATAQGEALDNPDWNSATCRFLIVRLSPFRDAARSTGHLFLHRLIRATLGPQAFIDFAFFPSKADRAVLESAGVPFLTGIAAKRSADEYDAVLVSCSYALELINVPFIFEHSGIPLRASERHAALSPAGKAWPPFVLGGSNAFASQALIFPDGDAFVDGIFFGEGEAGGDALVAALARTKGAPTAEVVAELEAATAAFWAAGFGGPGEPRADGTIRRVEQGRAQIGRGKEPLLLDRYPLFNSEEASTCRLQISWGCPSFCSFCFEGWERKPYRELSREEVLAAARRIKAESGASTADLYSFNFNAHEDALSLILELNRIFDRVNMMSQRADLLIRVPGMVACELAAEKRSFTVGVEGISARMRAYFCKGLSDRDLDDLMVRLAREKIRELKLFYILAGTEQEEDFDDFSGFCVSLRKIVDAEHPGMRVLFSAGYLVRMPFTPLRAEPLILDRSVFKSVEERCRTTAEGAGFEFRIASDWNEYVADQLLVSGGYALSPGLEAAARAGCCFDLKIEGNLVPYLAAALRESGELDAIGAGGGAGDRASFSGPLVEPKAPGYAYPLDFARSESVNSFLGRRLEAAQEGRDAGSCLGDFEGDCLGCGACEDAGEMSFLTGHRVAPAALSLAQRIADTIREKRRAAPVYLETVIPERLAGAEKEFLAAYLLKTILGACPELSDRLFRADEALRCGPEWRDRLPAGFTGSCLVALYGLGAADGRGAGRLGYEDAAKAAAALKEAFGAGSVAREGQSPAGVTGADFRIRFDRVPPEAVLSRTKKWLASLSVAYTERKIENGRSFDIAPKDRKKRIVESVACTGTELLIAGGKKIDLSGLFPRPEDRGTSVVATELRFDA